MELIRSIHNLRPKHAGCVATIGKFDGVHLGHKQILMQLKAKSKALGLPSLVILFEPHPSEFFNAQKAPARLNSLATKLTYLAQEGIDRVLCLAFNDALSAMSADDFIDDVLAVKLAVKHFVVGDDFRFGKGRQGSFSLLQERGAQLGFSVESTLTYQLDGVRVSSTKLRQALAAHDFDLAYALADRAFAITGRVMHGQKLARTFGVPTANVKTTKYNQPLKGVYAVLVKTASSQVFQGVANIGKRPTVDGLKSVLEVNIFGFEGDLYGQKITVEFRAFLREEQKFADLAQLKTAILNDVDTAKNYFRRVTNQ